MVTSHRVFRDQLKTNVGRNEVESVKWSGVMEMEKPTRGFIKVDVWKESRFGILPKISKPIWRGANIDRFHRFDLGVHDLLKTKRFTNMIRIGWSMLERFTYRGDS